MSLFSQAVVLFSICFGHWGPWATPALAQQGNQFKAIEVHCRPKSKPWPRAPSPMRKNANFGSLSKHPDPFLATQPAVWQRTALTWRAGTCKRLPQQIRRRASKIESLRFQTPITIRRSLPARAWTTLKTFWRQSQATMFRLAE